MRKNDLIPFEKSTRVIYLDKRGRSSWAISFAARLFGVLGALCLVYCVAVFLMGTGTNFFLIWGALAAVCSALSFVLAHQRWVERLPKWFKRCFIICCVAGLLFFGAIEGLIFSQFWATPQPGADYVIVLGAQWKENGPSYVLKKRLDAALDYLQANPETKVIVSGGQGSNEPVSEAEGMCGYLMAAGIFRERILTEDQSTNTCENLVFSSSLLDREQSSVVLVTNNFHMFRALNIAKRQGYARVEGLAAGSHPGMLANNLLREFLGVIKDFMVGNL